MQQVNKKKENKGFTLIEMLVVVLIIGILAAIALPQYKMAVTKAKVASILPIMRAFKDALMEWKLANGNYDIHNASALGVNWPSDWECESADMNCYNEYWNCFANEEEQGAVYCYTNQDFDIVMYQPDDEMYEDHRGMTTCEGYSIDGIKICKSLGGILIVGGDDWGHYQI